MRRQLVGRAGAAALLTGVLSCGSESPPAAPPLPSVEIREQLVLTPAAILPATLSGYRGVRVEPERLLFRWDGPMPIWIGAVVSGAGDDGVMYLREVVSIRAESAGSYELATREAGITDLIQRGDFVVRTPQGDADAPGQRASALIHPTVEFDAVGCGLGGSAATSVRPILRPAVAINEAHLRIAPAAAARCALTAGAPLAQVILGGCRGVVQEFSFSVNGSLDVGLTMTSERSESVSCSLSLLPRGAASTARLGPVVLVAGVPVQFSLTPDVTVNVSLSRTDRREVTLGRRVQIAAAMRYTAGQGWSSDVRRPTVTPLPSEAPSTEVEGSFGVFVNARFSADVGLLAGPYLEVSPGVEYRRTVDSSCEEEVTFGPAVQVSFGGAIRGLDLSVDLAEETFSFDRTPVRRRLPSCDAPLDAGVAAPRDATAEPRPDVVTAPDVGFDAGPRDAGIDRATPTDLPREDRGTPECAAAESRGCARCGTQSRPCVGGVWGAWSACAGQGPCEVGDTTTCAGSAERISCTAQCRWPTCAPFCGDGQCGAGETCATCEADCRCGSGSACVGGVCQGCGAVDQPCCAANACNAGRTTCYAGACRRCGAASEPCCAAGSACDTGAVCDAAGTGRCQVPGPTVAWSTGFEDVVIPRATGGTRLSNGVEISDIGGPRIGSGPDAGPSSPRALAIYGVGAWQSASSAVLTLPVALMTGRSASLSLWVRGSNSGPGDARIVVRRGMCPEIARTVRRSLGWHALDFTLDDCGLAGTGVQIQVGEYFEFPGDAPALSIDDIAVRYL